MEIRVLSDLSCINDITDIHMRTFPGYFLTFLGKGFLKYLYKGFITHKKSNIIGAFEEGKLLGFLAYSEDISVFYKYLIKKSIVPFVWYGFIAFLKKPSVFFRLLRALTYPKNSKREASYIELSSIGVLPEAKNRGIGSQLITELKKTIDSKKFDYIKLNTDKLNNDSVNAFYLKNKFELHHSYTTREGREMNEYRYYF